MATGTDITRKFAERLDDLVYEKRKLGKNTKDIAAESGVPSGSLSKYQNDAGEAGINSLAKLANYFGVSTDYLLGLTDIPHGNADDMAIADRLGFSNNSIEAFVDLKDSTGKNAFINHLSDNDFWDILGGLQIAFFNYVQAKVDEIDSFKSPDEGLLYGIEHSDYRPIRNEGELGFNLMLSAEHYYDFCLQQACSKLEGFMKSLADDVVREVAKNKLEMLTQASIVKRKRRKSKECDDNGKTQD
jgi:transcriptional regulator with XRE-family HTH domain